MPNTNTDTDVLERTKKVYKPADPSMYDVIIFNDDKTPMEVVVKVLVEAFDKDLGTAMQIMLLVHNSDKGLVGTYAMEEAYDRVDKADAIVSECESIFGISIPLTMTVEEH